VPVPRCSQRTRALYDALGGFVAGSEGVVEEDAEFGDERGVEELEGGD
jgi:hypothetical protein